MSSFKDAQARYEAHTNPSRPITDMIMQTVGMADREGLGVSKISIDAHQFGRLVEEQKSPLFVGDNKWLCVHTPYGVLLVGSTI